MKTKPFLVGSLLAAVVSFLLGYAWYMVLFKDMYNTAGAQAIMRPEAETNVMLIFVGILIGSLALAALYERASNGSHSIGAGAMMGALVGIIPGLAMAVMSYATSTMMNSTTMILESLYGIIAFGLSGAIIAFIYSKMDSPASS
jgi:uncharacterized membrane protein